jgi:hypothetical protein
MGNRLPLRDLLFGDVPLDQWAKDSEEWTNVRRLLSRRSLPEAIAALRKIAGTPGLESRHALQAWNELRQLEIEPESQIARTALGVVLEVPLNGGFDLLAAYADGSARHVNHSGKVIVWEHPDSSLDAPLREMLSKGTELAKRIGPWKGHRPPPPPQSAMRLNLLTPLGLMFGEAPMEALQRDPIAGQIIGAGVRLMQGLIAKTNS